MMPKLLITMILSAMAASVAHGQVGVAAVPFLTLQPSVRANGMGGYSVASPMYDPLAISYNPAHVSQLPGDYLLAIEPYTAKTPWLRVITDDMTYDAEAYQLALSLEGLPAKLPVTFGLSYGKNTFDLGQQFWTDPEGNIIGAFTSHEDVTFWSVGFGIRYGIQAHIGWSFKDIESVFAGGFGPDNEFVQAKGVADAKDFGLMVALPVQDILSKLGRQPFEISRLRPFITPSFGYVKANVGDKITYTEAAQADPLPRMVRLGAALSFGLDYQKDDLNWRLLAIERGAEAQDLLLTRDGDYRSGLADIDFFDHVIEGNTGSEVVTRDGFEIALFELFTIRGGDYQDPEGHVTYSSDGYSLQLKGVLKAAQLFAPNVKNVRWFDLFMNHVDIAYQKATVDVSTELGLSETPYQSIRISIH